MSGGDVGVVSEHPGVRVGDGDIIEQAACSRREGFADVTVGGMAARFVGREGTCEEICFILGEIFLVRW